MRVAFMGTPDFAVPSLSRLLERGHDVATVYTRAPRGAGRGLASRPSPVHRFAESHGLPVETPKSLREAGAAESFRNVRADVAVVVAYGLILPDVILAMPRLGCLNLHASLLPRWRGAAPIQRAIMAGDAETGIMVMRIEAGLDTGPIALAERVAIGPDATAGELHDQLGPLGAELLVRALDALATGDLSFRPQPAEGVTYAHKIDKGEARIDWTHAAATVHNQIRGLSPFPGAFLEADLGKGIERIKVLASRRIDEVRGSPGEILDGAMTVACGEGAVRLEQVQRAGRAPMRSAEFIRGVRLAAGARLG